jgi:membrane-bound lytic murein transglycosylase D
MALGTSLHAHLDDFARPNELLPNIAFWTRVYGEWTTNQIALVDTDDLGMLYRVIDVPGIGGRFNGLRRDQIIKNAKDEVASSLRRLDLIRPQSELEVAGLDREIFLSLKDIQRPDKYQRADFIRAQNGLRDRFEQGYMLSGAHDREIKARLKAHGLPEELIAVAFVESLFYPTSRSYHVVQLRPCRHCSGH